MRTAVYLANIRADVYYLSEVDSESYEILRAHPGFVDYYSCFCSNSPEFWIEWRGSDKKWMLNGTCVFLLADKFENVRAQKLQMRDGCAACFVQAQWKERDIQILFVSIHLDNTEVQRRQAAISPIGDRQKEEAETILEHVQTYSDAVDLVCISGDYNTIDTSAFTANGYKEYARPIGAETTPLLQGAIDHTLIQTHTLHVTGFGQVLHSRPVDRSSNIDSIVGQICDNVRENGSDHFATVTELSL